MIISVLTSSPLLCCGWSEQILRFKWFDLKTSLQSQLSQTSRSAARWSSKGPVRLENRTGPPSKIPSYIGRTIFRAYLQFSSYLLGVLFVLWMCCNMRCSTREHFWTWQNTERAWRKTNYPCDGEWITAISETMSQENLMREIVLEETLILI